MFADTATVTVQAGKGGDGVVSFRHEIYVDKGGPDGGDGGRGGDVIFVASTSENTLSDFRYKPELKARPGVNGSKQKCRGRSGDSLYVKVPVGTIVKRDGKVIADFTQDGQEQVIAKGGDGGFGNAHFKSSVRQTPRIAELGEAGDVFEADLELKLLADVGLLGFPNAGKSTFLSVVSNAQPEIANYAFTTLTPNLGVADIDDGSILIADIPGIIEGASEGKGLGDAFLKHVERTAVLFHMIDIYEDDVAKQYQTIRNELKKYSPELATRHEVVALTKTEGFDDELIAMQTEALKKVTDSEVIAISSTTHQGIKDALRLLRTKVQQVRTAEVEASENTEDDDIDMPVIGVSKELQENAWTVKRTEQVDAAGEKTIFYDVSGDKIEKFARRTNFEQFESVNRLRDIMKKLGITYDISRKGGEGDSFVRIGETIFTLLEQDD